ncbi:MAG: sel1 repeat family protein [Rhizobiales bacterium]|nr:sel1 repeat family protein [Hyphomicrobiales bacterium]
MKNHYNFLLVTFMGLALGGALSTPAISEEMKAANDPWQLDIGTEVEDEFGTLNPEELSLNKAIKNAMRGKVDMMTCAQGYVMTKMGNHGDARKIFESCIKNGYTSAMTWMSYMEHNGFGAAENPAAAAAWDKKAADAGDPIGQFNYGLDLLRGHGVELNKELGKAYIDDAAEYGLKDAIEVQKSDYDYNVVTPDADNWKYEKRIF